MAGQLLRGRWAALVADPDEGGACCPFRIGRIVAEQVK